ncbi:hypothetical protein FKM82_006984 [Ascaphus truei]
MANAYEHITSTTKWRKALPDDVLKRHWEFYESLFEVCCNSPRSLMHLARCKIRAELWKKCHQVIPQLPLPATLKKYLLLEPEGRLY